VSEYGQESLWRDTATADAERARDLAARLERRAKAEDEIAARHTYLGLLDVAAGERVLDVGCGSGAVTREIARRVGSHGLAVGLDPSPALLAVARELAQEMSLANRVEFREGDALRLPLPDRSFDAVVKDRSSQGACISSSGVADRHDTVGHCKTSARIGGPRHDRTHNEPLQRTGFAGR
jgi:SAM-dependent methyltransferase